MKKTQGFGLSLVILPLLILGCGRPLKSASLDEQNATFNDTTDKDAFDLRAQSDFYRQRYGFKNPYDKLVDNSGNGYENLYGIRNLRVVLHGIYYRGGANNTSNRYLKRDNENPLQDEALINLCEESFSESIYLYRTNFASALKLAKCTNLNNVPQDMNYLQIDPFSNSKADIFMEKIFDRIRGKTRGLLYAHCWNGWHASGIVAALALKQFCGWNSDDAVNYWIRNTDGDSNYPDHKQQIRDFVPLDKFKITDVEKTLICP